jgi:cell division inhibitor SepF
MASSLLSKISEFFGLDSDSEFDDFVLNVDEHGDEMRKQYPQKQTVPSRSASYQMRQSQNFGRSRRSNSRIVPSRVTNNDSLDSNSYGTPKIVNNGYAKVGDNRHSIAVSTQEGASTNSSAMSDNVISMKEAVKKVQDSGVFLHRPQSQENSTLKLRSNSQKDPLSFKIAIKDPRVYSEAVDIGKLLIKGEAVLVNFHLMEEVAAGRVIDFLTGTVFALDGDIQRVGDEIFLVTPKNMEINGELACSLLKYSS